VRLHKRALGVDASAVRTIRQLALDFDNEFPFESSVFSIAVSRICDDMCSLMLARALFCRIEVLPKHNTHQRDSIGCCCARAIAVFFLALAFPSTVLVFSFRQVLISIDCIPRTWAKRPATSVCTARANERPKMESLEERSISALFSWNAPGVFLNPRLHLTIVEVDLA